MDGARVTEPTIELTFPAKAEYVFLCRLALGGLARTQPLSEELLADLKLALTEACSNSVRHAYADEGGGHVEVVFRLADGSIEIEVADEGKGFDPAEAPGAGGDLDESGLGMAIIRSLADEVEVTRREGGGSTLRFAKRLGD